MLGTIEINKTSEANMWWHAIFHSEFTQVHKTKALANTNFIGFLWQSPLLYKRRKNITLLFASWSSSDIRHFVSTIIFLHIKIIGRMSPSSSPEPDPILPQFNRHLGSLTSLNQNFWGYSKYIYLIHQIANEVAMCLPSDSACSLQWCLPYNTVLILHVWLVQTYYPKIMQSMSLTV